MKLSPILIQEEFSSYSSPQWTLQTGSFHKIYHESSLCSSWGNSWLNLFNLALVPSEGSAGSWLQIPFCWRNEWVGLHYHVTTYGSDSVFTGLQGGPWCHQSPDTSNYSSPRTLWGDGWAHSIYWRNIFLKINLQVESGFGLLYHCL